MLKPHGCGNGGNTPQTEYYRTHKEVTLNGRGEKSLILEKAPLISSSTVGIATSCQEHRVHTTSNAVVVVMRQASLFLMPSCQKIHAT